MLKGPFPMGEETIAKDITCSMAYAYQILKGRFPLAEPNILKSPPLNICFYALQIIKGRWEEAEPILQNHEYYRNTYNRMMEALEQNNLDRLDAYEGTFLGCYQVNNHYVAF